MLPKVVATDGGVFPARVPGGLLLRGATLAGGTTCDLKSLPLSANHRERAAWRTRVHAEVCSLTYSCAAAAHVAS